MKCPACNQAPSFLRSMFTLQGVPFPKAMQDYSRCQHCGKLLRISNINLLLIVPTVVAVAFVAVYVLLFPSIVSLVGFKTAVGLFFPCLVVVGITGGWTTSAKFTKFTIVEDDKDTISGTSTSPKP